MGIENSMDKNVNPYTFCTKMSGRMTSKTPPSTRFGAISGMFINHSLSYRFDANKLQMS